MRDDDLGGKYLRPEPSTSAAPAPIETACPATVTRTCTVITTTITTTSTPQACLAPTTATQTITEGTTTTTPSASAAAAAAGVNIQLFTGTLGGPPPPVISSSSNNNNKRPFAVKGDTFVGSLAALGRSCDQQHNACADAANSGSLSGGVGQCDRQNDECHSFMSSSSVSVSARRHISAARAALDLGSCSDTTILFQDGLDGRKEKAFIAASQEDFDHGSALKIGVIAGFVCQRLESRCKAGPEATAACARASAAAVAATQGQEAADAFNGIMAGAVVVQTSTARGGGLTTTTASAAVKTGVVVQTITSCA